MGSTATLGVTPSAGTSAAPSPGLTGSSIVSRRLYSPPSAGVLTGTGPGVATALLKQKPSAIGAAQDYLNAMATVDSESLKANTEPVTSLVPEEKGVYRLNMLAGEKAFREGNFRAALDKFQLAGYIAPRAPETLLSMAHAHWAMSTISYSSAAYYLRQTLKYLPELAVVPLQPKGFFAEPGAYVNRLEHIQNYVNANVGDADARLCLAYLYWFSDNPEGAKKMLSEAVVLALKNKSTNGTRMVEAIDTFWAGMVATGKVSGELGPSTRPAKSAGKAAAPPAKPDRD